MTIHHTDEAVTLYHGDCIEVMRQLPDNSVDAVVTDPPYGLEFMGKEWDAPWKHNGAVIRDPATERGGFQDGNGGNPYSRSRIEYGRGGEASLGFQQWFEEVARECLRVLKPGGHLLAFGGTRTWHRLACAIEDAGFEVRDSIAWMYGSGFPKSLDVSKAMDKAAGAEREVVREWAQTYSGGAGKAAGYRPRNYVGKETSKDPATDLARQWQGWGTALKPAFEPVVVARKPLVGTVAANVERYGTGALNIDGARIAGEPWQSHSASGLGSVKFFTEGDNAVIEKSPHDLGRWPANVILDESQSQALDRMSGPAGSNSTIRGTGSKGGDLFAMPERSQTSHDTRADGGASRFFYTAKADSNERPRVDGVAHPTVKPLDLMRYLVRLVTPPGGVVLEPFAGSGTTLEACIVEGFRCIGIEREDTYLPLIMARISKPIEPVLW